MSRLKPVSGLEDHLGFWLRRVSNAVSQAFEARLQAQGVTIAEWVMLRSLYDAPGQAPSLLAGKMGMTKGGITKLADRLIGRALVVRRPDPEDARAQSLCLTPAGERLVPHLAALADANDAALFGPLSAAERKTLGRALRRLAANLANSPFPID